MFHIEKEKLDLKPIDLLEMSSICRKHRDPTGMIHRHDVMVTDLIHIFFSELLTNRLEDLLNTT